MSDLIKFNFHGDELDVVRDGERILVSVRRVCEALGLDHSSQVAKLRRKTWSCMVTIATHDASGRSQEMLVVPHRALPMWLATIEPSRVKPELREKLERYQLEAADALARYFLDGVAVNPRAAPGAGARRVLEEIEVLAFRQRAAAELALLARDVLAPAYVEAVVKGGIAVIKGEALPGPQLLDSETYLLRRGLKASEAQRHASRFGTILADLYKERYGERPKKGERIINGGTRLANIYVEAEHLPLFDVAFERLQARLTAGDVPRTAPQLPLGGGEGAAR